MSANKPQIQETKRVYQSGQIPKTTLRPIIFKLQKNRNKEKNCK